MMTPGAGHEADREEKCTFIGHMRHELRTPIGGVIGYSELLLEDIEDSGENTDLLPDLEKIRNGGKELLSIVNDMLAASRLETMEDIDMSELGVSVRQALRTPANAVIGYCDLLVEDTRESGRTALSEDLEKIRMSARKLIELTDDIINYRQVMERDLNRDATSATISGAIKFSHSPGEHNLVSEDEKGRILVVDDNENNRDLLARQLERRGHTVSLAEDGVSALEEIKNHEFDLVLLDVMMPGMNGYEVLERIKSGDSPSRVPVIMISALTELDTVVRCIEVGAEDYLPKPFNPTLLNARINAGLRKKRLHDMEKAHLEKLRGDWAKAKHLEDNLKQLVRVSLQRPPEEMLTESLRILMGIAGASVGMIVSEEGPSLSVLYASQRELIGQNISWESIAGRTAKESRIIYSGNMKGFPDLDAVNQQEWQKSEYLLSVPVPSVISTQNPDAQQRASGAVQLLFEKNVLHEMDMTDGFAEIGLDLSGKRETTDRLLQDLLIVMPIISLGMELTRLRQTSYQAIHELKNKLLSATAWIGTLGEDLERVAPSALEDDDIKDDFELADDAVRSGSKLAVSYLQFTKIYNPQYEECQINDVIRACADDIRAFGDDFGGRKGIITVLTDLDDQIRTRQLDPDQLRMAFFNLGKNAVEALIQHGAVDPAVYLTSRSDGAETIVEIKDNGKGMPQEIASNLFVAFKTKKEGGTGLGLTITKKIIDVHGGEIRCDTGPNGTIFTIRLQQA